MVVPGSHLTLIVVDGVAVVMGVCVAADPECGLELYDGTVLVEVVGSPA